MNHTHILRRKNLLLIFFIFICAGAKAQNITYTKYFDSVWTPVAKADSAYYISKFVQQGELYEVKSYWAKSNLLSVTSFYADTSFGKPRGRQIRYYTTGQVQDSLEYDAGGYRKTFYHYYPSGKLSFHSSYDTANKKEISEAYEENGTIIPGYIYQREAFFPTGNVGWTTYLSKNLNANLPVKKKAPKGTYEVVVKFIVDKDGRIADIDTETDPGYGMKGEAIRVIKNSPKWLPSIMENKPVNAYRRQPITFVVQ